MSGTLQVHVIAFKKPQVTYCEGGVLPQCLIHCYMPKLQFKVQAGKMSSAYQTPQCLLYSGQRVGVLFCVCI